MAADEVIEALPATNGEQEPACAVGTMVPDAVADDVSMADANVSKNSVRGSKSSSFHPKSETSTQLYEQMPFAEFKAQVQELCHLLWSPSSISKQTSLPSKEIRGASSSRILTMLRKKKGPRIPELKPPQKRFVIERMAGGSYNRVTGITIIDADGIHERQLVLRVPRYDWAVMPEREAAVVRYVRQHSSILVPEIIEADFTSNNPLKSPYVVQKRIPGITISAAGREREMSSKQWCTVAREVGRTMLALQDIINPTPGIVEASGNDDGSHTFRVSPFDIEPSYDSGWKTRTASVTADQKASILRCYKDTTFQFLITQFGRWMADELARRPDGLLDWDFMYRLAEAAAQMNRVSCLGDNTNCLTHLDLAGRNIMAEFHSDESVTINGILDWDSAIFVPRFVACAPPWWLWQDENDTTDYQEDETKASETPTSPLNQAIKRAFEQTVGEDFLFYAYEPQFRIARKLFHIAVNGCNSSTQLEKVESFLEEWAAFYKAEVEGYEPDDTSEEDARLEGERDASPEPQIFQDCESPE